MDTLTEMEVKTKRKITNDGLVTIIGGFDELHEGHYFTLGFGRALGTQLVVGLEPDQGKRFFEDYHKRADQLLGTKVVEDVDTIVDVEKFLKKWMPAIHCIRKNQKSDKAEEISACLELGIEIVLIPDMNFKERQPYTRYEY